MLKIMQLISNKIYMKNVSLSAITFSFDQFDEKINHTKISKSSNFEVMGCKGNYSFIQSFAYLFTFIRFKIFNSRWRSNVQEIIM